MQASDQVAAGDFSVVSHRGWAWAPRKVTENTIRAAQMGMDAGATAVEIDVQPTRDDGLVVMHDAYLGRTTRCRGRVSRKTLNRIVTHCRGQYDRAPIPSLDQMLAWGAAAGANLLIDIKTDPRGRSKGWSEATLTRLVTQVEAAGMTERVRYMSFRATQLAYIEQITEGEATTVIVLDPGVDATVPLSSGAGIDVAAVCVGDVTPTLRGLMSEQGVALQSRATDNTNVWSLARDLNAQTVMVERPDNYRTWEATGTYSGLVERFPCGAPLGAQP